MHSADQGQSCPLTLEGLGFESDCGGRFLKGGEKKRVLPGNECTQSRTSGDEVLG